MFEFEFFLPTPKLEERNVYALDLVKLTSATDHG